MNWYLDNEFDLKQLSDTPGILGAQEAWIKIVALPLVGYETSVKLLDPLVFSFSFSSQR